MFLFVRCPLCIGKSRGCFKTQRTFLVSLNGIEAKGADYSLPPFEILLQSLLLGLRIRTVQFGFLWTKSGVSEEVHFTARSHDDDDDDVVVVVVDDQPSQGR